MKKKKILIIITLILLIITLILFYLLFSRFVLKSNYERDVLDFASKNQTSNFKISKIVLFSNVDCKTKNALSSSFNLENIFQYTDIAVFLDSETSEKTASNTLKSVSISNIKWLETPLLGQQALYFKSINNFSKSEFNEENKINETLYFNITSDDQADLDTPILYNNLANPITLSYINSNIKTDYTITDTANPITYDGSLLKKINVDINNIKCNFSFDVLITNNLDQNFKTTVFINVPLEDSSGKTIYDGKIQKTITEVNPLYR